MATLNNTTSPTPSILPHVSVLDFFVSGSTSIISTIELVLSMNNYARPLFGCLLLPFLGIHVFGYLWRLAKPYFGSPLLPPFTIREAF